MPTTHPNLHYRISSLGAFNKSGFEPHNFTNVYPNQPNATQTLASCPHQMSIMNLFPNIYGPGKILTIVQKTTGTSDVVNVFNLSIPDGYYTYLSLPPLIESVLNTVPGISGATVSISPTSFKTTITIVDTSGFDTCIASLLNLSFLQPSGSRQPNISLNLWLGAGSQLDTILPSSLATELPNVVNLAGPSSVSVYSTRLAAENSVSAGGISSDYLASIDLSKTPFGSWARTDIKAPKTIMVHYKDERKLEEIDISLTDLWQNPFNTIPPQTLFNLDLATHRFSS